MNGVAITTSSDVEKFAQQRHAEEAHSGSPHRDDRDEEVERRRDRGRAGELDTEREECLADRGCGRERRVGGPAGGERAARREERPQQHQSSDRQQPERQRVQARERHVRGADHQRQHEVREPREHRDHEQEDHQRRVYREQSVVGVRVDELAARLGELHAHQHREQPGDHEVREGVHDVLHADHLVVGVDAEVVLPAARAVGRVILRARRAPDRPVEPVVERAQADQEGERADDHRHLQDGRPVEHRVVVGGGADRQHDRVGEPDAERGRKDAPVQAWGAEPGDHCDPSFVAVVVAAIGA
jgi:hypothetical protein